jgi:hypothetical protein
MLRNYFLIALRNLRHNKLFSLINILGLAIGISASLVIFLIVRYDFSFDRFEPDGNRIYRVVSDYTFAGNEGHGRGTQAPLADIARKELTGPDQHKTRNVQPRKPMNFVKYIQLTRGYMERSYQEHPQRISDQYYWYYQGTFTRIPVTTDTDGDPNVIIPQGLKRLIGATSAPDHN